MNQLKARIGEHAQTLDCEQNDLASLRSAHNAPLEIVAFGQNIFLSLMGTVQEVTMEIVSATGERLDFEEYQLRF